MFNPAEEISSIDFSAIIGGALNAVVNAQRESAETTVNFVRSVGFKPGEVDPNTGDTVGVGDPICVTFSYDKEVSPSQVQGTREIKLDVTAAGSGYSDKKTVIIKTDDNSKDIAEAEIKVNSEGAITKVSLTKVFDETLLENNKTVSVAQEGSSGSAKLKVTVIEAGTPVPAVYQKMQIEVPILTMMPIPFIKIDYTDIEFNVKINSVSTTNTSDISKSNVDSDSNFGYKGWGFKASTNLKTSVSHQKKSTSGEEVKKDYSLNIKVHAVQDDIPSGMSRILDILEDSISTKALPASSSAQSEQPADKQQKNSGENK
ncbi:MAG: DUF2589 domain-containing protein [Oscillospiraceae bacterium]|nr:DUF2589 domain-containing protein [Oscillospiraceae bacterium]